MCYLVGLRDPIHAASGPMGGAIFETLVVTEIYKTITNRGQEPALYFWRTAAGSEVDLVVESEGKLIPLEIKAGATARPDMAKEIAVFRRDFEERAKPGYVIYSGKMKLPLGEGTIALPFSAV